MDAVDYLRRREWSMGNGQCHECCGLKPGHWFDPSRPNRWEEGMEDRNGFIPAINMHAPGPEYEGHKKDCDLAKALESLGEAVIYKKK